jgi:hypothetical protein
MASMRYTYDDLGSSTPVYVTDVVIIMPVGAAGCTIASIGHPDKSAVHNSPSHPSQRWNARPMTRA